MIKLKENIPLNEIQERYSRVLGMDNDEFKKQPNPRSRWMKWISIFFILALVIYLLTIKHTVHTEKTENIQKKSNQVPASLNNITQLDINKTINSFLVTNHSIHSWTLYAIDSTQTQQDNESKSTTIDTRPRDHEMASNLDHSPLPFIDNQPSVNAPYLAIVKSTLSKNEAIIFSKQLREKGYLSEVILSLSGYYGVAIGRFDYENGNDEIKEALESGAIGNDPYLMQIERVGEYVFPKTP